MVFRQFAKHWNRAKVLAGQAVGQATRIGGGLDKAINWAHRAYQIASPALGASGVPGMAVADQIVNRGYDAYNQLRDKVAKSHNILNQTHKAIKGIEY
jgi:hypothetical protein